MPCFTFAQIKITNLFQIYLTKKAKPKRERLSKSIGGIHTTKIPIGEKKMKQKFFAIGAIAVIAIVGLFVFEHATSAQRPDRNAQGQRGNRQGGERGGRGMMGMMNYASLVDNSWLDLTFGVKVDDETLVKARPIYQVSRNEVMMKMEALRQPDTRETATKEIQAILKDVNTSLKEILTEEEMAKLSELTKKRVTEMQQRTNRWRGGGEGGRRGGGGGRGSQ